MKEHTLALESADKRNISAEEAEENTLKTQMHVSF